MKDHWWLKFVGLAVILRILLSSFLYHPDLKGIYHEATLISKYGWVKGYEVGVKENTPLHYPPPVYLLFATYQKIGSFLFTPNFNGWIESLDLRVGNYRGIYRDLLLMKMPIIITDLVIAWLLLRSVSDDQKKQTALIWLFNPFSLYAIYGTSHFDVVPTSLTLASVICFGRKKTLSYIMLGAGAGFKLFPLLLIPFWWLLDNRRLLLKTRDLTIAILTLVLSFIPILLSREALSSILLSNLTTGLTKTGFDIGNNEHLPIYGVFYGLMLILTTLGLLKKTPLAVIPLAIFGVYFGLNNFHPQWMLWLMPFLLLLTIKGWVNWRVALLSMVAYFATVFLISDTYMTFALFSPTNEALISLPSVRQAVDLFGVGSQLQGFFHAVFLACMLWFVIEIIKTIKPNYQFPAPPPIGILKLISLLAISIGGLVILLHSWLTVKGMYIDFETLSQRESVVLSRETTVQQDFIVTHNNFKGLQVMIKNIGLKSKADVYFTLTDKDGGMTQTFKINGGAIGDDFNLKLVFKQIRQSATHRYSLIITSPGAPPVTEGTNIAVPYDSRSGEGLYINGKNIPGSLSYTTYFNPGSFFENLSYTFNKVRSRI